MTSPINSPYDTAVRTLCALDASWEHGADEDRLRLVDLFSVFSADVGGPPNLHPSVTGRLNAWTFRLEHLRASLDLLSRAGLAVRDEAGVWRRTNDPHVDPSFQDEVGTRYVAKLSKAARWLARSFREEGEDVVRARMMKAVAESGLPVFPDGDERFLGLAASYRSDLYRLEAIAAVAEWIGRAPGADAQLADETTTVVEDARKQRMSVLREMVSFLSFLDETKFAGVDPVQLFRDATGLFHDDADDMFERLQALHDADGRFYHRWDHVLSMLKVLAESDPSNWRGRHELILAIFFHDAVYDPKASDNERRSAELLAEWHDTLYPDRLDAVTELIMATDHRTVPTTIQGNLIADLDLSILASDQATYDRYVADVRREYADVSDEDWRVGRTAVLSSFLDRPAIYRTGFLAHLEETARANLERELASLG